MSAKQIGAPWRPGQSGNPSGRPRAPDHLRHISSLTQIEVNKLVSKYARMTRDELQQAVSDSKTPMLEVTIASIFAQSAKHGDYTRLSFLLDRAIGKVQVAVDDDENAEARRQLASMSTQELIELARKKIPELGKAS